MSDANTVATVKEVAATAKLRREMNQLVESLCNEIYTIAHKHQLPVILMHQDNIYIQDDDHGTARQMLENLDKEINN